MWKCQSTSLSVGELHCDATGNDFWGGVWGFQRVQTIITHIYIHQGRRLCSVTNTDNKGKESCDLRSIWTTMSTTIADTFSCKNSLTVGCSYQQRMKSGIWLMSFLIMALAICKSSTSPKTAWKVQKQKTTEITEFFHLLTLLPFSYVARKATF